ncbi:LysR substrate-binding domain-containing protein [Ruegeria sp. HKCCD7318]|uniref:LysR substrate-binding domain-containing protein n=1 Tax=Ruegeria sp. HKCCD7318 TaxID=2683014 RepID=UPI001490B4D7|nr:LysR substrate-binding domain-containing protein [Ruegeria sp. HKCCD7318]NOE35605.1 LysR family transcriptional regulator [Ruegeria sp. HKCCD7318]
MDRFHALNVFVKVAELKGFAAAARHLRMSPPTVSRMVSMLEESLGLRLFVRTTRSVMLTDSGQRFFEDAKRILADLEEAERAAIGSYSEPTGELSVTASVLFGRMFITPLLGEFLDLYPKLSARTLYVDRVVNLIDEGLDVGIRIGNMADSSLMAVKCGAVRQVLFASPAYLDQHGEPETPEDLSNRAIINSTALNPSAQWHFQTGRKTTVKRVSPRISMNTNDAVIELALRGHGIGRLLSYQVAPYIADGRLKTVLKPYEPPEVPIHLVHQEGRTVSAKVRAFVDFAAECLKSNPLLG